VKNMFFAAALIAAMIPMASAQDVKVSGQPMHVNITGQTGRHVDGDVRTPAGMSKVFSNLGPKGSSYDNSNGWLILGPDSAFGQQQWVGYPFTPAKTVTATYAKAALGWFESGPNQAMVSIYSDANGVPGKPLVNKWAGNLQDYTDPCCDAIKNLPLKPTVLKANTQYWFVARTGPNQTQAEGVWFFATGDPTGNQAYSFDGVTWNLESVQESAFAVYSTP
jgi:hypothetical protein